MCRFTRHEASLVLRGHTVSRELESAMAERVPEPSAVPATWETYAEAGRMFLHGATAPSATRIALIVGTWLVLMNHGDTMLQGSIPWLKIALDYATPFVVASLGFLAARRRANVERLSALLRDRHDRGA
ncbi:MAG: nitrate/nitrite transporter NrtS [Candidatus Binatia bacterium]